MALTYKSISLCLADGREPSSELETGNVETKKILIPPPHDHIKFLCFTFFVVFFSFLDSSSYPAQAYFALYMLTIGFDLAATLWKRFVRWGS